MVSALSTSIALSFYGDASRQGIPACSSSRSSPLLGYAFLAFFGGAVMAIPALWSSVRVLRTSEGFAATAPRASGVVLAVVGLPVALVSLLLSAFSYTCLF